MTKFGELISVDKPVLIDFYTHLNESQNVLKTLRDVASSLGNGVKVIKINIEKNQLLADALRIKEKPTFMIYKNGEMKWRKSGNQSTSDLINSVKEFV
ncbi:thioredoxin family protein [Polaribacter sp.]|nr:thioredoxin family protein [Polaribacter sp.]